VTSSTDPQPLPPPRPRRGRGVITGLITALVALGVGQLVAGITSPQASPVVAVGEAAIDLTPPPLKNFAISEFGSNDKAALVIGILVLLTVFAAAIGVAAMRRLAYGLVGLGIFTGIGLAAALSRPTAGASYAVPVLIGGAAGVVTMVLLVRAARADVTPAPRATADDLGWLGEGTGAPEPSPRPRESAEPGASWVPAKRADTERADTEPGGTEPGDYDAWRSGRRGQPATPAADRRQFLVTGTVAVAAAGASALVGRALAERTSVSRARAALRFPSPVTPLPPLAAGDNLPIRGLSSFVTPNSSFYRVDTAIILPQVSPDSWQLRIHGMVAKEMTLTLDDLLRLPLVEDWITLCCVSNPVGGPYIGNAKWLGAKIAPLLRAAGIRAGAEQLLCTSVDGFTSGTPVQTVMDGRDALLAVAMNGSALPVAHGFPARLVVPGLYGYVSACKWITDIKVTTWANESAYWAQRGWSQQAPIKTECRIDVPGLSNTNLRAGKRQIAGVAWAQHKGIDAVEVRVDGGAWQHAKLASVPGIDTWRQWVLDWDATHGNHVIEARATDVTGYTQTAVQVPPVPNGATGYPAITVTVQ
jgi:DMSO/TMAO reductase YedYZ molybdopterin-dependent catalytic subunit